MPTSLIGIGGALTAGKDTVADHLVDAHGFKKEFMSEPLARALEILNPVIEIDSDHFKVRYARLVAEVGYTKAKEHPEVRRLLQVLGTEIGRNMIGEDTWVRLAGKSIDNSRYVLRRDVTITGIRFKNEIKMIKERGGILLWVHRPELELTSSHASENSVSSADFDEIVMNDGSLEELFTKVDLQLPSWRSVTSFRTRDRANELDFGTKYDW